MDGIENILWIYTHGKVYFSKLWDLETNEIVIDPLVLIVYPGMTIYVDWYFRIINEEQD